MADKDGREAKEDEIDGRGPTYEVEWSAGAGKFKNRLIPKMEELVFCGETNSGDMVDRRGLDKRVLKSCVGQ